jgi:hypothetical protein
MVLKYPSIGDKPLLFVHVEDVATGNRTLFPILLDTRGPGRGDRGRDRQVSFLGLARVSRGRPSFSE